jgi:hypothetical protein
MLLIYAPTDTGRDNIANDIKNYTDDFVLLSRQPLLG